MGLIQRYVLKMPSSRFDTISAVCWIEHRHRTFTFEPPVAGVRKKNLDERDSRRWR